MNEEIDIIELLQRVKEGKAPKRIEINGSIYNYEGVTSILYMYEGKAYNMFSENIDFGTKIKILDKPIIEKLTCTDTIDEVKIRVNKIIDYINQNNKE